jgi:hypothetical protein
MINRILPRYAKQMLRDANEGDFNSNKSSSSTYNTFNTSQGTEKQSGVVVDVLSEGPIYGLVDDASSVLLNGVPILDPVTKVNYGAKVSNDVSYVASTRTVTDNSSSNIFQNRNINDGTFRIFIAGARASGTGNINTTSGSTQITSTSSFFTPSLVGSGISIPGAGPNGSIYYGYINYRINGTNVSVYPPVSTSVSGANILVNLYAEIASFSGNTAVLKGSGTLGRNVSNVSANITTPYVPTATSANKWNYTDAGFAFRSGTRDQSFLQLPSSVGTNSLTTNVSQTLNTTDFNAITFNGSPVFPVGYIASGGWKDVNEPDAARLVFTSDGMGIPNPGEVDVIKVTIKFPSGLIAIKPKDGNESQCFAEFQILFEYSVAGDFSDTVTEAVYGLSDEQLAARTPLPGRSADSFGGYAGTFLHGGTVFKKTKTPFVQTFSFDVSKYQPFTKYRIKIAKISPTNGKNERRNWGNATQLQSIQNIITDKLSYPYTAYGAVIFGAKEFTSVPRRSYEIRGLQVKVPTNYFSRHELGEGSAASYTRKVTNNTTVTNESDYQDWDGNFRGDIKTFTDPTHSNFAPVWTDNPVWILLDILTNDRYGLGKFVDPLDDFSYIDKFQLFQIAKYCDELVPDGKGGTEPRFTANLYLSKIEDAQKVVNDLLSVFRGLLIWFDGKFSPSINAYKSPVYTFTKGNVIGGEFAYQSSSRRFRSNQVRVTWNNPDDNYQQAVEIVEDTQHILETGKIISKDVVATGCTSQGQAHRFGKWNILTEKLEKEVVTFSTGLNAIALKPGDVIEVQDADRENTEHSGRVSNTGTRSTTVIPLDREISLNTSTKAYSLNLIYPKGGAYLRQENATINSTAYVLGDLVLLDEDGASIDTQQKSANVKDDSGNLVQLYWSESVRVESKAVDSFTSTSVTVSSAFSETPDADVIWSLTSTTIATGEEETDISPKEYIIIRTEEKEKNQISIAAAEYSDAKFELIDRGYTTEIVPLSQKEPLRTEIVPAVESLVASVSPSTVENSTEGSTSGRADLLISWQPPLQVRESTSSTISGNVSSSTSITLSAANENIEVGMRVRHSSISGVVTVSSIDETALTVSTAVSLTSGDELSLKHDNPEPSIAGYHVTVQGPNTSDMADWQSRGNGYYKFVEAEDTIATMKGIQAGTYYIHVKAENTIKNKSASETVRINYTAEKYSFPSGQNKLLGIDLGGVLDESLSVNTSTGLVAVASSSYSFTHSNGIVFKNTSSTASTYQQSFSVLGADSTAYLLYDKGSTDTFKAVQIYTDTNVTDVDGNKLNFEYWIDINDNANNGLTTKTGTVSLSDISATVTGTSTSFTTEYTEGDLLIVGSGATAFYAFINFIESDTIMDLDRVPTRNYSGATIKKLNFVPNFAEDQIIAKITTNGATEYSIDETYAITAGLDGEAAAAGENARSVKLTASSFVVRYNTSNTVTTNNITFVAEGHGTSGTETFSFLTKEAGDSSFTERQGFSHTPDNDQFTLADSEEPAIGGETQIKVEMNESGAASNPVASDTVTIYAIQDGAAASAGDDAVTAFLTNSAHVASTNPGGTNPSYTNAGGLFDVYVGADRRTLHNDVSFYVGATGTGTSLTQNGLTFSINNTDGNSNKGTYTLSGSSWTSTEETFTVRAVVANTVPGVSSEVVITRIYSISKSKEGQQGVQGDETVQVKVFKAVTYNANIPTTPSGGTYDFTDNTFTPPSGWSITAPAQAYLQVVYTSVATVSGASTETAVSPGTFSSPTLEIGVTPTSRTVYQRSATNLTTAPNSGSAIDYQTAPTGWSFTIPSGSNPLYAAFGSSTFSAANRSLTVIYGTPIKQEADDPINQKQINIYRKNSASISSSSGTFSSPLAGNTSWSLSVPGLTADGDIIYVASRLFTSDGASPQDSSWSTPVKYSERNDGSDGQSARTVSIYKLNDATVTSTTGGSFSSPLSGNTDWSLSVPSLASDSDAVYVSTRTFTSDGNSPQDSSWSTPAKYSERNDGDPGSPGAAGLRTIQGYLFYEKTTSGAPSAPSGNTYTFSTGVVTGTGISTATNQPNNVWNNVPNTQDATSSNTFYSVRYYGTESSANSSTITVAYSNVVKQTSFTGVVTFSGGTLTDGTSSVDPIIASEVASHIGGTNTTTIDGGKISTGTIVSTNVSGGGNGTFTTAGTRFNLDNGWISTPQFKINSSGTAEFKGTLSGAGMNVSGYLNANGMRFGSDVNSTNDGIFINSNNYWYSNGNFSLASGNITWQGSTLAIQGNITANSLTLAGSLKIQSTQIVSTVVNGAALGATANQDSTSTIRSVGAATSGTVGGWNLTSSAIYSGTLDTSGYTTSGITLYSGGSLHSKNFYIDTSGNAFFKGTLSSAGGTFTGQVTIDNTDFDVSINNNGALFGGTTFSNSPLSINGATGVLQSTSSIVVGTTPASSDGFALAGTGDIRLFAGAAAPSTSPLTISKAGKLFTKNLEFYKGNIKYFDATNGFSLAAISQIATELGVATNSVTEELTGISDVESVTLAEATTLTVTAFKDAIFSSSSTVDNATALAGLPTNFTITVQVSTNNSTWSNLSSRTFTITTSSSPSATQYSTANATEGEFIQPSNPSGGVDGSVTTFTESTSGTMETAAATYSASAGTVYFRVEISTTDTSYDTSNDLSNSTSERGITISAPITFTSSASSATAVTDLYTNKSDGGKVVFGTSSNTRNRIELDDDGSFTESVNEAAEIEFFTDVPLSNTDSFKRFGIGHYGIECLEDFRVWGESIIIYPNGSPSAFQSTRVVLDNSGNGRFYGSLRVGSTGAASGTQGTIQASNDIVAFYSSDKRLKENISPLSDSLEKISKIRGVEFDWKKNEEIHPNEGHDVGVIAQEIEKVLPEVVTTRDSGYKAVKYEKIVPLLIEAIKELKAEIDELKDKQK